METTSEKKRIVKNTLFLYTRMIITMIISLYTSRVILNTLGVENFGIYNVVGGFVLIFGVISNSLSSAIGRFITFELGKGDIDKLKNIFSTALIVQMIIGCIILLFSETIGLWFLNNKMNIPSDRIIAANWVFQFSLFTFIINLINVPYNSCIIAHEKMAAFAYISILDVLGKLLISYLIIIAPIDKLIYYAFLMFFLSLIIRYIYLRYCHKHFSECSFILNLNKSLLRKMFGFAGWNFIGSSSSLLRDQGVNVIINMFMGPTVNASRGIASQVNSAISNFFGNFMMALSPQITKSYSSGNFDYMITLIEKGAKFSFYLLLCLSIPIWMETEYILKLWLGIVPEYTISFVRLILILTLSESISNTLVITRQATGNIKKYQIIVGGMQMMNFPISYIALKYFSSNPTITYLIAIMISQICFFLRLILMRDIYVFSPIKFFRNVYISIIKVSLLVVVILLYLEKIPLENIYFKIIRILLVLLICILTIFYIGCNKNERSYILVQLKKIYDKSVSTIKR